MLSPSLAPSASAPTGPLAIPRWWIEAAGRLWGPYPRARLESFVGEGRLTASSLVARSSAGPFSPAALDPGLEHLFVGEPEPSAPTQAGARIPARPEAPGAPRPVIVFAALSATRPDLFEGALAAQGESVRIAPGLWLVRARLAAAPLRNLLSRRLRPGDVLFTAEIDAADAAWFALPGDTDRVLRRLLRKAESGGA